eukprot:COSAG05_NODE_1702_length_4249_cov_136.320607_6_plen_225_part_00
MLRHPHCLFVGISLSSALAAVFTSQVGLLGGAERFLVLQFVAGNPRFVDGGGGGGGDGDGGGRQAAHPAATIQESLDAFRRAPTCVPLPLFLRSFACASAPFCLPSLPSLSSLPSLLQGLLHPSHSVPDADTQTSLLTVHARVCPCLVGVSYHRATRSIILGVHPVTSTGAPGWGHWVSLLANKSRGQREYILLDSDNHPVLTFRDRAVLQAYSQEEGLRARLL